MTVPATFLTLLNSTNAVLHRELEALHLNPFNKVTEQSEGVREVISGQECLNFGTNDYLGLKKDPRMIEAAATALRKFGTGVGASRLLCGSIPLHRELEEKLSDWLGREDTIVFTTGYGANLGAISAILNSQMVAICDNGIHSSIVDGCLLSGAKIRKFRSGESSKLGRLLRKYESENVDTMLLVESVYSMEGNALDIEKVVDVKKRFTETPIFLDEAHSIGVMGDQGSGMGSGCLNPDAIDLVMGVLSKSLGSCGGFVSGSKDLVDAIRVNAHTSLFTTGSVPAALGAAICGVDIAREEGFRREIIRKMSDRLRKGFVELGLTTGTYKTQIVPVYLGDPELTVEFSNELFNAGIYAGLALYPAVPKSKCLLRFCISALHREDSIDQCLEKVAKIATNKGLIQRADDVA